MAETVPPGSERNHRKRSRERTTTTPNIWSSRRTTNLSMSLGFLVRGLARTLARTRTSNHVG
jgi:hypothetical protein